MDLWERGQHVGLVGETNAEGATREGMAASVGEEEEETVAQNFHEKVLLGKLRQAVLWATGREGEECLLPDDQCTKIGQMVADVLQ